MADSGKMKDEEESRVEIQAPSVKAWVLRVPIHCEGCKKKVKRIVTKTEGLVSSDIDIKQQKVTVTGNIDINALIARLVKKMGKPAEVWPEDKKTEPKERNKSKPKPHKEKPPIAASEVKSEKVKINEAEIAKDEQTKPEEPVRDPSKQSKSEEAAKSPAVKSTEADASVASEDTEAKQPSSEMKSEENIPYKAQKSTEKVEPGKAEHKEDGAVDGGASGKISIKKKKKGQNGKQKSEAPEPDVHSSDATETRESKPHRHPRHHTPPRQFQSPPHYYGAPPSYQARPIYTVSYNATTPYPSWSHETPSYYAVPPPHTEAYTTYSHSGSSAQYPPSHFVPYQSQPSDSFGMFSDENPNACSLM